MALPAGVKQLGTFQGLPGDKGDTGTFVDAHAIPVAAGETDLKPILSGPESAREITFKTPRGLPGVNAVPTDEAVATMLAAPDTQTSGAVKTASILATSQKIVEGGIVPLTVRQPTLVVEKAWPNRDADYRIVWYEDGGQTLYAVGMDYTLRKSTTRGTSWDVRGRLPLTIDRGDPSSVFLKLANGTLLTFTPSIPTASILRSTDDGVTWSTVFTGAAGQAPMGPQGWCVHPVTGDIYYGEYQSTLDATATTVNVYRSADGGATWPLFHAFPGPATSDPNRVRHVHSIHYDHIMGRMVVATGDSVAKAGLYRTNAAGTALEPMLLNDQVTNIPGGEGARAIGYIPFQDHIVFMGDASSNPYILRVARSELGKLNPHVERLYRVNSTGWWATRASDDGSRWVVSCSPENPAIRLDSTSHLYAIEDQGDTITEVGSLGAVQSLGGFLALAPVGSSTLGGDVFMLTAQGTPRTAQWMMRLARGSVPLQWPEERPRVYAWQTQNSGVVTFTSSETIVPFTKVKAPAKGFRYLRIYDAGITRLSGAAPLNLYIRGVSILLTLSPETHGSSYRSFLKTEAGGVECASFLVAEGQEVSFEIRSNGAASGTGYVTYGWGN